MKVFNDMKPACFCTDGSFSCNQGRTCPLNTRRVNVVDQMLATGAMTGPHRVTRPLTLSLGKRISGWCSAFVKAHLIDDEPAHLRDQP